MAHKQQTNSSSSSLQPQQQAQPSSSSSSIQRHRCSSSLLAITMLLLAFASKTTTAWRLSLSSLSPLSSALRRASSSSLQSHTPSRRTTTSLSSTSTPAPETEISAQGQVIPTSFKSTFLQTLSARGYIHQCTDFTALDEACAAGEPIAAYLGFDATAPSLHVGSLLQIMILRHLQKSGHKPLVLMGGGTTKVGDPSGKDEARKLMTYDMIQGNIDSISAVFRRFLTFGEGPTEAVLVNNDDWLSPIRYLDFLRDYGQHFTINRMLNFESVKVRLERESPLSFLEFNYMILQAYDFLELSRRYNAKLQLGGSDQWGNIINGVELARKVDGKHLFGLTAPLMTTSDGKKMGKTASGAVWLKRELLSEYEYWQFWRNTNDADVLRFLKLFTELPLDKIEELARLEGAGINEAKVILADEATKLLHGEECLAEIHATVANLFSGGGSDNTAALPRVVVGKAELGEAGLQVAELFVRLEMAKSKAEARRLIKGGGARLDGEAIKDETFVVTAASFVKPEIMLSAGKKKHGIVELSG